MAVKFYHFLQFFNEFDQIQREHEIFSFLTEHFEKSLITESKLK